MSRFWGTILATTVLTAALPPLAAQAQPAASAEETAKAKFKAGKQAYRLGDFDEAIALWKEAYRLKDNPAFLFNIGQAYREKGDLPKAVQFFENYLKDAPKDAENRAEVELRVAELKKLIEDQKAMSKLPPNEPVEPNPGVTPTTPTQPVLEPTPGTGPTPLPVEPPAEGGGSGGGTLKIAGYGAAGVGVALVATGVVFGLKARSAQSDVEAAVERGDVWTDELDQKDADGRSAAKLSTITFGLGGAAVVTGGVLIYLGMRKGKTESSQLSLVPHVGARGAAVSLTGSF